jgi:hypothetical protein
MAAPGCRIGALSLLIFWPTASLPALPLLFLVWSKIALAAVPKPDPKLLRDLVFLLGAQRHIEPERPGALTAAGGVGMIVPMAARQPNEATDLFDESRSGEFWDCLHLCHWIRESSLCPEPSQSNMTRMNRPGPVE